MAENLDLVYLLGFSENSNRHIERILPLIKAQKEEGSSIGIVFLHDGVLNTLGKGKVHEEVTKLFSLNLDSFVMSPDLDARGITTDNLKENVKPIDYLNLVDILDNTPKIISWM